MQFHPRLHQLQLLGRKITSKHAAIFDSDSRLEILIANMEMRQMMAFIALKQDRDENSVNMLMVGMAHSEGLIAWRLRNCGDYGMDRLNVVCPLILGFVPSYSGELGDRGYS